MLYQLSYQSEYHSCGRTFARCLLQKEKEKGDAATRDRTRDLQIFSLTLSQLSYSGEMLDLKLNNHRIWKTKP